MEKQKQLTASNDATHENSSCGTISGGGTSDHPIRLEEFVITVPLIVALYRTPQRNLERQPMRPGAWGIL